MVTRLETSWKQTATLAVNSLLKRIDSTASDLRYCDGALALHLARVVEETRALKSAINSLADDYKPTKPVAFTANNFGVGDSVDIRDRYQSGPRGYAKLLPRMDSLTVVRVSGRLVAVQTATDGPEYIIERSRLVRSGCEVSE